MSKSADLICVSLTSWESNYTRSTVQLMAELARNHRVIYVNYAPTLLDAVKHSLGKKRLSGGSAWQDHLEVRTLNHGGQVYIISPAWVLPINALPPGPLYNTLLRWNARRILRSVRRVMKQLSFQSPVLINAFHPTIGLAMQGQLDERACIYYCYDEIKAEPWSRKHGEDSERQLLARCKALIVSSKGLFIKKSPFASVSYLIENGVNFNEFYQAYPRTPSADRPTVGYIGAIDNRLDTELLEQCFEQLPNLRFLLVGRVTDPALKERLGRFANVELAGSRSPDELPSFLRQMDVGLIPFRKNEQTQAIYPMKLNEYLAVGLPVVTTNFADLSQFEGVITVADQTTDFVASIWKSIVENNPEAEQRRITVARGNSWEQRGQQFEEILRQVLFPAVPA